VITFGYDRFLICSILLIFTIVILSYIANFDRSMDFTAVATKNNQLNTLSTLTDQVALQKRGNISSNETDDIKAIRNSISEQVQLLKNMTQGFARVSTQASFAALGVFLLGLTLVLYGLRLTVRATAKETSIYFKVMMWALITPVIALIAIYQFGVVTGTPLGFVNTNEPFFFISLLLLIPTGIVVFLLIAEKRVLAEFHKKQP
jgi:hypothetical protein